MPLDPQVQKVLKQSKANGPAAFNWMDYLKAREMLDNMFLYHDAPPIVACVEDHQIPCPWGNLGIRLYVPEGNGPFPALVFYHGGGWVTNNIETHDSVCRHIARFSSCVVVSVEYRRPPEYKFPAPIEDAYTAMQWVFDNAKSLNIDSGRIAVGGDSSGGNMAAVICMLSRDRGGPDIKYQLLIYPVLDYYLPGTKTYEAFGSGYILDRDLLIWCWNHYLHSNENINNPYICPLRADSFSRLPPALIITAEYDPLREEDERYAEKLKKDAVPVKIIQYKGMVHGFILHWRVYDKAMECLREIGKKLKLALEK